MINVFISYCNDSDRNNAERLFQVLRNNDTVDIEPIIDYKAVSHTEENAEKIARLIDSSHIFIAFYTKEGHNNQWVNQEIGYAFSHAREYGLKILLLYHDWNDFEKGFVTSITHNLSKDFQLGNGEDNERIFQNVSKYITEEYSHPIVIEYIGQQYIPGDGFNPRITLSLTNNSPKNIPESVVSMAYPKQISIKPRSRLFKKEEGYRSRILRDITHVIPKPHSNKLIHNDDVDIERTTLYIKEIYGLNAYEMEIRIKDNSNVYDAFSFAMYLHCPFFGTTYYQANIDWKNQTFKLNRMDERNNTIKIILDRVDTK